MGRKNRNRKVKTENFFDYTLLFVVLFLLLFGLIVLYSVSSYEANIKFGDGAYYLKNQMKATVLGLVVFVIAIFVDYHVWEKLSIIAYVVSLCFVLLILTPLGRTYNGARRWLDFGGISLQPVEIVKVALIMFLAAFIAAIGTKIKDKKAIFWSAAIMGVPAAMIFFITRNASSAIIIAGIATVMFFMADPKYLRYVGLAIAAALFLTVYVFYSIYKAQSAEGTGDFRKNRIVAWLNPDDYASDTSFQTIQGMYAIGSGGVFGKGLGESVQKMKLPEAQNDMVFCIICEELGVFGGLCVMALFLLLIYRCMVIASNAPDTYGALLVSGVMGHFALQVLMNIAVVTNSMPNTGVTLPFISYGGTSVLFLLAEVGIVLNVSKNIKTKEVVVYEGRRA
ncbi:MAG: cell division protein FtsW [Lachnospiraceae bacterium]|nr:cell division protein FtsW [Lachnospiraceae bacterium]